MSLLLALTLIALALAAGYKVGKIVTARRFVRELSPLLPELEALRRSAADLTRLSARGGANHRLLVELREWMTTRQN